MNGIIPSLHPAVIFADVFMSKSLSLSGGDEEKAKWKYIELRAERLSEDSSVNVKEEEEEEEESSPIKSFFSIFSDDEDKKKKEEEEEKKKKEEEEKKKKRRKKRRKRREQVDGKYFSLFYFFQSLFHII